MEWTAQCSNIGCLVDHPTWTLLDIRNNAITHMFRDEQNKFDNCHKTGMAEVAKPIIMVKAVQQGLQGSYFLIWYLFQNPVNHMYALSYHVNFIWNEILMNSMKYWNALSFFPGYCLLGVDQSWNDLSKRFGREGLASSAVQMLPFFPRPVVTAGCLEHSKHIMPPSACRMNILFICSDSSKPFSLIHHWKVLLLDADDWLLAENDDAFEILTVECCYSVSSCMTESKEPFQSLLLAFALSGWLTVRNFTALFVDG